jgi:nucleotide-binding universal stress UspA family protein
VSLRLAAHCRCPAVFVPLQSAQPTSRPDGEVVLGIEAREPTAVVDFAFSLAAELGASVRAVHAWEMIPPDNGYYYIDPALLKAGAESVLADPLTQTYEEHYLDVRLSRSAVCDRPAAALADAARDARLLVLGSHRHRTPLSVGLGPVLHALLTHAPCPVAVVPVS